MEIRIFRSQTNAPRSAAGHPASGCLCDKEGGCWEIIFSGIAWGLV
jgi:hypothetical protein